MIFFVSALRLIFGSINLILLLSYVSCSPSEPGNPSPVTPPPSTTTPPDDQLCPIAYKPREKVEEIKLSSAEIAALRSQIRANRASLEAVSDEKSKLAESTDLLAGYVPPEDGLKINEKKFYLSKIICHERPIAILYSEFSGQWYAHLMYRSKSNGVWRSSRYYDRGFDKGEHYTQDMLPNPALDKLLNDEKRGKCLILFGTGTTMGMIKGYFAPARQPDFVKKPTAITSVKFKDTFKNYDNGFGFIDAKPETRTAFFASMTKENLPKDFFPNFSCLTKSYRRSHSLFSNRLKAGETALDENIKVDVFLAKLNDKVIEWHFAYVDKTHEPWISRIRFADAAVSVLGADENVIDSGALTVKPADYYLPERKPPLNQIKNLIEGTDFEKFKGTDYADVRKFIQNFPPIIEYKKYKDATGSW